MAELTRYIPFRIEEKEYRKLKKIAEAKKYKSFSAFIRDSLLEHNGICSKAVKKQMHDLRWEINKIGVNINQAAKRINSGFGSRQDIQCMIANQEELKILLEKYLEEVESVWQ